MGHRCFGLALVLSCSLQASSALAQDELTDDEVAGEQVVRADRPHTGPRPITLDVQGGLALFGPGFAGGLRVGLPLLRNGFVTSINNAVYLSLGADFYWGRYQNDLNENESGPGFGVPIALHWEFYFSPKWSAFAELGVNVYFSPGYLAGHGFGSGGGAWLLFMLGGKLHFNEHAALMIRIGTPATYVGLSFSF